MTDEPEEEIREIRSPSERIMNAIDLHPKNHDTVIPR